MRRLKRDEGVARSVNCPASYGGYCILLTRLLFSVHCKASQLMLDVRFRNFVIAEITFEVNRNGVSLCVLWLAF